MSPIIRADRAVMHTYNFVLELKSAKNPLKHPPIATNLKMSQNKVDIIFFRSLLKNAILTLYMQKLYHVCFVLSNGKKGINKV